MDQAVADLKDSVDVAITWEPYFLKSDSGPYAIPPEGRPLIPAGAEPQFHRFGDRAKALGIDMMGEVTRVPNSMLMHVLLDWAHKQRPEAQNDLKELCFSGYYSKNIFLNAENLAIMAGQAGYDQEAARAYLESGQGEAIIRAKVQQARQAGVTGIPHILVNNKSTWSGAQGAQIFKQGLLSEAR